MHLSAHQNIVVRRGGQAAYSAQCPGTGAIQHRHQGSSTLIFYDSLKHDGSLRVYKHLWSSPYRKGTTKQAMLETLKELTGFQEAHTFGSIPGAYDTYINAANGDELVKRLMTELEPIGISHG